jgi:hypothetical protein
MAVRLLRMDTALAHGGRRKLFDLDPARLSGGLIATADVTAVGVDPPKNSEVDRRIALPPPTKFTYLGRALGALPHN